MAHAADLHLGLARHEPRPGARLEDFRQALRRFVEVAVGAGCDLAVLAGDTFHTRYPAPRALAVLSEAIRYGRDGGLEWVIEEGNHDGPDALGADAAHTVAYLGELAMPGVHVLLEPGTRRLLLDRRRQDGGTKILHLTNLPYPHKRAYDHVRPDLPPGERPAAVALEVAEMVRAWGDALPDDGHPRLLVGHLTVAGATLGSERTMGLDWDVSVPVEALAAWDYAALGHVHRQQRIGDNAAYAGSPQYMDFGELGEPKGFLVVDVERGHAPVVKAASSLPRPLQKVVVTGPAEEWSVGAVEPGAVVQPIVSGPQPGARDLEGLARDIRAAGAYHVLPAQVDAPERRRRQSGGPSADLDPAANLRAWVADDGNAVPLEERSGVLDEGLATLDEVFA